MVVPAAVIITLKGNETFDWVKLSNLMFSFNSVDALKARFLDIWTNVKTDHQRRISIFKVQV